MSLLHATSFSFKTGRLERKCRLTAKTEVLALVARRGTVSFTALHDLLSAIPANAGC